MSVTKIVINVDNLPAVLARFTHIQVWRSPDKSGSPTAYSEVTAAAARAARVDGSVEGNWDLDGLALTVTLDGGTPFTVTFTGDDPLNLEQVLTQLNAAFDDLAEESGVDTGKISIVSPTKGTGSSVVLSGSACAVLGLSTTKVNGKAERLAFATATEDYTFQDLDGDPSYWYKVRYYSSVTGTVSTFSDPKEGTPTTATPSGSRVTASANLADGAGRPIVGRRFIFVPMTPITVTGTSGSPYVSLPSVDRVTATTDESGHMEISLLIGQTFRVFVEGSSFHRELVVPDEDFDIFEVVGVVSDGFDIVQAPPMPIRTS
jgi:hypothetical protein